MWLGSHLFWWLLCSWHPAESMGSYSYILFIFFESEKRLQLKVDFVVIMNICWAYIHVQRPVLNICMHFILITVLLYKYYVYYPFPILEINKLRLSKIIRGYISNRATTQAQVCLKAHEPNQCTALFTQSKARELKQEQ